MEDDKHPNGCHNWNAVNIHWFTAMYTMVMNGALYPVLYLLEKL